MSEPVVFKLTEEALEDFNKYWERGNFFAEEENFEQAFKEYLNALESYRAHNSYYQSTLEIKLIERGKTKDSLTFSKKAQIDFLFELFAILLKVRRASFVKEVSTGDYIIKAYLSTKLIAIVNEIEKYENSLSVDEIKQLRDCKEITNLDSSLIAGYAEKLEALSKVKPENTDNPDLKEIRVSLQSLTERKICPVNLESSGGCFIATEVYSDFNHLDVRTLRCFRDKYLLTNKPLSNLVDFYYKTSPRVINKLKTKKKTKQFIKFVLSCLSYLLRMFWVPTE